MKRLNVWVWFLLGALVVGLLVVYLAERFPDALGDGWERLELTRSLLLLALIGASLVLHRHVRLGNALRQALIWAGIGAVLLLGYSYRFEIRDLGARLASELVPSAGRSRGLVIEFPASAGGHFLVEADVDGHRIRFLVDTGASDVSLAPRDAQILGFDLDALSYTRHYRTANGVITGAPVTLGRIAVGPIVLTDVRASVTRAPLERSLLGMSFLGRLSGFEVRDRTLVLRQ